MVNKKARLNRAYIYLSIYYDGQLFTSQASPCPPLAV